MRSERQEGVGRAERSKGNAICWESTDGLRSPSCQRVSDFPGGQVGGRDLALLCQVAENRVVGAPCGIMDQMASALGKEGHLLVSSCTPGLPPC